MPSVAEKGATADCIMDHTGHRSVVMVRVYTRRADAFADHAGEGLLRGARAHVDVEGPEQLATADVQRRGRGLGRGQDQSEEEHNQLDRVHGISIDCA